MRLAPWAAVATVLLVAGLSVRGRASSSWSHVEISLLENLFVLRGREPASERAVIVNIDQATLERSRAVVEERTSTAALSAKLREAGASAVAFDLVFTEEEQWLGPSLTADLRAWFENPEPGTPPRAMALLEGARALTLGDEAFAAELTAGPSLLGVHLGRGGGLDLASLSRGTYGQVVPGPFSPPNTEGGTQSFPPLSRAASRVGVLTFNETAGSIHRVPLVTRQGTRHFASFGVQLAALHLGVSRSRMAYLGTTGEVRLADRVIPTDAGVILLDWRREPTPLISALDVLEGRNTAMIEGRIAIVAYGYLGNDLLETPWGKVPAVNLHTALMDNLVDGHFLLRTTPWQDGMLAFFAGGWVVLGLLLPNRLARVVFAGLGIVVGLGAPIGLFLVASTWSGLIGPVLAASTAALVGFVVAWVQEGADARALRKAFSQYVSEDLLRAMMADPSLVQLQGQRRNLSILFSDIRDFTTYSERIEPLALIGFLNHYLTPMTRAVLENRGYVDKFIGDAVMALFGAPVADDEHAQSACRAALDMHVALSTVRPEAVRRGINLDIGIGVNSGEVAVGNMGSSDRVEYTALGDAVNLASRLESLTKTYKVFCLIGPATAAALPATFITRRIDLVRVKGKERPVEVHELCGDDRITVAHYGAMEQWELGLDRWRDGGFTEAREHLQAFLDANPDEPVAQLYLERLAALTTAPEGWDGVFTHTTK